LHISEDINFKQHLPEEHEAIVHKSIDQIKLENESLEIFSICQAVDHLKQEMKVKPRKSIDFKPFYSRKDVSEIIDPDFKTKYSKDSLISTFQGYHELENIIVPLHEE
jgi:hypothetical protein